MTGAPKTCRNKTIATEVASSRRGDEDVKAAQRRLIRSIDGRKQAKLKDIVDTLLAVEQKKLHMMQTVDSLESAITRIPRSSFDSPLMKNDFISRAETHTIRVCYMPVHSSYSA